MPQDNTFNLEKLIYNTYLRISRTKQGLPFRYRKNFNNFEDDKNYVYVRRLYNFFKKFGHVNIEEFFLAPYYVYSDPEPHYDLKFYTSPRAVKVFGSYMKIKDNEDPDSQSQILRIKASLMFIFTFCKDTNIQLDEYTNHMTADINTFILHLRDRKVSIYTLFGFENFENRLMSCPNDRLNFTLGQEFINKLANYKVRYYNSNKLMLILKQGLDNIKNLLHKLNN